MKIDGLALRETLGPTLALFAGVGTLVCCALPALFVTLGLGAVMAGLATNAPGLVFLSENKNWTFAVAGALLLGAATLKWRTRNAPCPIDPEHARACQRLRRMGTAILVVAFALYGVGAFFAYAAAALLL